MEPGVKRKRKGPFAPLGKGERVGGSGTREVRLGPGSETPLKEGHKVVVRPIREKWDPPPGGIISHFYLYKDLNKISGTKS
jgi:hypothetical protein